MVKFGEYSISLGWHGDDWAFGWADMFAEFGIGSLVVGPLHVQVTWPVDAEKAGLAKLVGMLEAGDVDGATELLIAKC